jgi:hypothetical protein
MQVKHIMVKVNKIDIFLPINFTFQFSHSKHSLLIYPSSTWMLSMHLSVDSTELVDFLDKWLLQTRQVINQGFLVVKSKSSRRQF